MAETDGRKEGRTLPAGTYGFSDIQIGDRIVTPRREVAASDIDVFAELTGDRFVIHMDDAAARSYGFPARVAHGLLVLSLIDGLKNQADAQCDAVASLGWTWSFQAPVFIGDVIHAVLTIAEKRPTKKSDRAILKVDVSVTATRGDEERVVQSGHNLLMVWDRVVN